MSIVTHKALMIVSKNMVHCEEGLQNFRTEKIVIILFVYFPMDVTQVGVFCWSTAESARRMG
jgi:hypothetical protein